MGNFSWIQFIQKKKQPIFFPYFHFSKLGQDFLSPQKKSSKIQNSPLASVAGAAEDSGGWEASEDLPGSSW